MAQLSTDTLQSIAVSILNEIKDEEEFGRRLREKGASEVQVKYACGMVSQGFARAVGDSMGAYGSCSAEGDLIFDAARNMMFESLKKKGQIRTGPPMIPPLR